MILNSVTFQNHNNSFWFFSNKFCIKFTFFFIFSFKGIPVLFQKLGQILISFKILFTGKIEDDDFGGKNFKNTFTVSF